MTKGIAVHRLSQTGSHPPLEVTCGTECEGHSDGEDFYLPRDGWRVLVSQEGELLRSDSQHQADVFLLTLPMRPVDEFRSEIFSLLKTPDRVEQREASVKEFSLWAVSCLNDLSVSTRYEWLGANLALAPPGLRSTAFDPVNRRYKGLHIDNHERLPNNARNGAFVLFNINVGIAERYFQFVNLEVKSLLKMLGHDPGPLHLIKSQFFRRYPDYPVLRATIGPGSAYLCQTQNVIHDGATNVDDATDISLLIGTRRCGNG